MTSQKRQLPEAIYPDPRTLYIRDEWPRETWMRQYRGPVGGAAFAAVSYGVQNYVRKRPLHAGIQLYFVFGLLGGIGGYYGQKGFQAYFAFRDQVFRHYIATHPEDFPLPERKKVGENWEPWIPIR